MDTGNTSDYRNCWCKSDKMTAHTHSKSYSRRGCHTKGGYKIAYTYSHITTQKQTSETYPLNQTVVILFDVDVHQDVGESFKTRSKGIRQEDQIPENNPRMPKTCWKPPTPPKSLQQCEESQLPTAHSSSRSATTDDPRFLEELNYFPSTELVVQSDVSVNARIPFFVDCLTTTRPPWIGNQRTHIPTPKVPSIPKRSLSSSALSS
ncbi:hypothetical protein T265_05002 [Opisthorchis viverrini]|uniref:Uncharacterized protein n=1 Tax=Opisthorchis viverrini TaxID=6198 RepID=A0A074ZQJ3_OPIVI|nr:hypothetical protein T265_05002 [Opisthorchis viverrini]KER28092.1 hypothetical protein T265_05002 [Opisthorchis viverrini]